MTKKIFIISILLYCTNVFAQDTLFQCDFSVHPIQFDKKYNGIGTETTYKSSRNIIPSLTMTFPIHNKFSFTIGLNLYGGSYEGFFNDSVEYCQDPTDPALLSSRTFIYHNKVSGSEMSLPIVLNYNLYSNKYISTNVSLGIEADLWDKVSNYYEFYPISPTNILQYKGNHFNSPIDESIYLLRLHATIKYFPLKHFGLFARPFITYSIIDDQLSSSLGIGICYR